MCSAISGIWNEAVGNLLRLLVLVTFVLTGNALAERLPVKTYTVADGALRDSVYKIKRDSRGFLWLCSAEGISFFDGQQFTNFTPTDGLPNRQVNDFLHSRKGNYWIATDAGLALLDSRGVRSRGSDTSLFTVFVPPGGNGQTRKITVLHEDDHGVLVGTAEGLYRFDENGTFTAVELAPLFNDPPVYVTALLRDRRGNLWIGTDNRGLIRLRAFGAADAFGKTDGLPNESISALMEDTRGLIWAGSRYSEGRLFRLIDAPVKGQPVVEKTFSRSDIPGHYWVTTVYQALDGNVWVGSAGGGLCRVVDDEILQCDSHRSENNICDGPIWSIAEDGDGNLWLGTQCGTKKWSRYGFTSYGRTDGLAHPSVTGMFETPAGDFMLAFGISNLPVARFDDRRFQLTLPNFPAGLAGGWGWKQIVHADRQNNWWFASAQGVYKFSDVTNSGQLAAATPEKIRIPARSNEIFRVFVDSRRDLWVQTFGVPNELFKRDGTTGEWQNLTAGAGISSARLATAFVEDARGNIWIATGGDRDEGALLRYREGKFDVFKGPDNELTAGWLRDLYIDPAGRLWIASNSTGLLRLDDLETTAPAFVRYGVREGLSSIAAYCVTGDKFGRIYVGSGRGIDRLDPATGHVENFSTADGLPSAEVWTSYADRNGRLWFASTQGLARYDPEPPRDRRPPATFISGFRVLGDPMPVDVFGEGALPEFKLAAYQQQVTIDFFGLGSSVGEKLRYEYRLAGGDWTASDGRTVNFANLSPGDYRFEVRAITADRLISMPAFASFSIAAPFWQRWWFVTLAAVAIAMIIYFIYRSRLSHLLELERTRTRIATDLHDDIGSNLAKISLLSDIVNMQMTNGSSESKRMLASMAEISRSSVDSMRDIVWSINPNRDSVLEMTRKMREHAEDTCVPNDILVKFEPDPSISDTKLSMEVRREMFLIFKEAVNNAARHSECSLLTIELRATGSGIFLKIADNGSGFDTTSAFDGNGIGNMEKRARKMNGSFRIESNGDGTVIDVRMPI